MTDPARTGPWPVNHQDWRALLEWLYQSPPLLAPPAGSELLDPLLEPHQPDDSLLQQASERFTASSDRRLGKLFEVLLGVAVEAQPQLDILARNVVISSEQRTLGELDMIIRDRRNQSVIHVEATLKFYLGLPDGRFPGPNPKDTLARKHHHLASHQFPLTTLAATRERLATLGLPAIDRQCLFSRGRLFYPHGRTLAAPPQAWPGHARGDWWRAASTPSDCRWRVLSRPQWLAPESMSDSADLRLASDALIDYVQARHRPLMVVRDDPSGDPCPAFVVPDRGWPT